VALGTVGSDVSVTTFEGESRFFEVIEVAGVEGEKVGVTAAVFLMAHCALIGDFAVYPSLFRDPGGDGLVAGEAVLSQNLVIGTVAAVAGAAFLEGGVRLTQRTGHEEVLVFLSRAGRSCPRDAQKNHNQ
jgi:hypothetical protein